MRLAAIGLGDFQYARSFRQEAGIDFPLLVDAQREAYRIADLRSASILHLFRKDNLQAARRAASAGHHQHRLGRNPFQLGGTFLFAPGNVDRYVHVSETFSDHAPIRDILAALL